MLIYLPISEWNEKKKVLSVPIIIVMPFSAMMFRSTRAKPRTAATRAARDALVWTLKRTSRHMLGH
jgi:hypothetical protein